MSSNKDDKALDLSSLNFGPSWARTEDDTKKKYEKYEGRGERHRGGSHQGGQRGGKPGSKGRTGGKGAERGRERSNHRPQGGERRGGEFSNHRRRDQREQRPRREEVAMPEGLALDIMPVEEGVDNLAKQISDTGRTYSVFDLARVVLGGRERFNIVYRQEEGGPKLYQCRKESAVFLTKEECLAHFSSAEWRSEFYTEEEKEAEPPAGNYTAVGKCGYSGELLGPPNYHGYQTKIAALHAERFANMPLERYKSRIKVEQGEEGVNAWKESMKKVTCFKEVEGEKEFSSLRELQNHFLETKFADVYHETHRADVLANVPAKSLSPGLLTGLKEIIADQRRYPGKLSSFLCRQISGRQLAVFKWQGKLHAGPSRPHSIPEDLTMAERPQSILDWVKEHSGEGIDKLWAAVLPVALSEEAKKEWYHDLHWLINQGYVLLMSEGQLYSADKKKQTKGEAEPSKKKPKVEAKTEAKTEAKSEAKKAAPEVESESKGE